MASPVGVKGRGGASLLKANCSVAARRLPGRWRRIGGLLRRGNPSGLAILAKDGSDASALDSSSAQWITVIAARDTPTAYDTFVFHAESSG